MDLKEQGVKNHQNGYGGKKLDGKYPEWFYSETYGTGCDLLNRIFNFPYVAQEYTDKKGSNRQAVNKERFTHKIDVLKETGYTGGESGGDS